MTKLLFLANAMVTIGFGFVALFAPQSIFLLFGFRAKLKTQSIIRGYASAALSYGTIMFLLRSQTETHIVKSLTIASFIFNAAECVIQLYAISTNIGFNQMIYSATILHALLSVWSLFTLCTVKSKQKTK